MLRARRSISGLQLNGETPSSGRRHASGRSRSGRCPTGSATASRSSAAASTSTPARRARSPTRCARRTSDYLEDWDERGAPWEYWVEKSEEARDAFAGLVNADADEVAVTTSVSAGLSADRDGPALRAPLEDRHHRLGVPDGRTDLARAGAARRARRPHRGRRGRDDPARALRAGDRRGHGDRLGHACLLPERGARRRRRGRADRARARRARRCSTRTSPPARSDRREASSTSTSSAPACSSTCSARPGSAFLYCRREVVERVWPTATGWFADKDIFKMDHRDYSPAPTAAASSRGRRRCPRSTRASPGSS